MPSEADLPPEALPAMARKLLESVVAESVREMDAPHLVICMDPHSGTISFQGPYPDGLSALLAADLEDPDLEITVAPLLPPY